MARVSIFCAVALLVIAVAECQNQTETCGSGNNAQVCGESQCCMFGRQCRDRPTEGGRCGLGQCPCAEGLECRPTFFIFRWRCMQPETSSTAITESTTNEATEPTATTEGTTM